MNNSIVDNRPFHRHKKMRTMADEITVSHLLRERNSFVQHGWPYGTALANFFYEKHLVKLQRPTIVEVGAGLGHVADNVIEFLLGKGILPRYSILELSPNLITAQKRRLDKWKDYVTIIQGDAEHIDEYISKADLVFANEVIGDFRVIKGIPRRHDIKFDIGCKRGQADQNRAWRIARGVVHKYGLGIPKSRYHKTFAINYGAIKFIEKIWDVLVQGGHACLIEYTSKFARRVRLRGHDEYSISTNHIKKVCERIGFGLDFGSVDEFLRIPSDARHVDFKHVNLWLAMGVDPYSMADERGEIEVDQVQPYLDLFKKAPTKYVKLDKWLTPDEFNQIAKQKGWKIGSPDTEKANLHKKLDYFILHK